MVACRSWSTFCPTTNVIRRSFGGGAKLAQGAAWRMSTSHSPPSSSLSKFGTSRAGRTRVAQPPNEEAEVSRSEQSTNANSSTTEVPSPRTSPAANEKTSTADGRAAASGWSLVRTLPGSRQWKDDRKKSAVALVLEDGSGSAKEKTKELTSSTHRRTSCGVPTCLLRMATVGASTSSPKVGPSRKSSEFRKRSASEPSSEAATHGISAETISEISATLAGLGKSMGSQQAVLGELKASMPLL